MGSALQWLIVALAVCAALGVVLRKYFPARIRSTRQRVAIALLRNDPSGLRRKLGQAIAPPAMSTGKNCDSDCGGCD